MDVYYCGFNLCVSKLINTFDHTETIAAMSTPNPIDIHVGQQIRLRRKFLGMSQTALADKLGITFQQVQKYEKGSNRVGASRLLMIAEILGADVGAFFEGNRLQTSPDHPKVKNDVFSMSLDRSEGLALIKAFRRIKSKVIRKQAIALFEALADEDEQSASH